MYRELIDSITTQDRHSLAAIGVPSSRVSEWRTGLRFPTRPQALALSVVKNVNFDQLERDITALETAMDAKKNEGFKALMQRVKDAWHFT